jgi:exonuclease III
MRANARIPRREATELPTRVDLPVGIQRTDPSIAENRAGALRAEQGTGQNAEMMLEKPGARETSQNSNRDTEQANLERATREVAEFQVYWRNRHRHPEEAANQVQPQADANFEVQDHNGGSQALSTLTVAQHEWRKVLDGMRSTDIRRPLMHLNDAAANLYWGDECLRKEGNIFRLYAQNVNGIPLDRRGGQFDTLCQVLKEAQADVFLGQEHNLDSTQYQVRSILHDTSKQHWERYRLNIATTPIQFTSMYKPGGTFMLTTGNATGRIISQDQDKWGRWVSQSFQGVQGRIVTIVSAYQVVTDVPRGGSNTVTTQQYCLLLQDNATTQSPRTAFRKDLMAFLHRCRSRGDELIVMGDFNEAVGGKRTAFSV